MSKHGCKVSTNKQNFKSYALFSVMRYYCEKRTACIWTYYSWDVDSSYLIHARVSSWHFRHKHKCFRGESRNFGPIFHKGDIHLGSVLSKSTQDNATQYNSIKQFIRNEVSVKTELFFCTFFVVFFFLRNKFDQVIQHLCLN